MINTSVQIVKSNQIQFLQTSLISFLKSIKRLVAFIIIPLFIFLASTIGAKAQDSVSNVKYRRSYWVDFGTGFGGEHGANNFLINAEISKGIILTYAYDNTRRSQERVAGKTSDAKSLLLGKVIKSKSGLIRFSVGLSIMEVKKYEYIFAGYRCTNTNLFLDFLAAFSGNNRPCTPGSTRIYKEVVTKQSTIGIPLDLQLMLSSRWGGIGINPHVNLNLKFPYASLTLQASLGRIR